MGQCYEKNKIHIIKWQQNNKEKVNEACRKYVKMNYDKKMYYCYERITKQFRRMENPFL